MGKNVAVFVDVANVFYAAKAAGVDIDYVTLLKSVTAGRDLVRAYAYTGLDPDNENQRNFHEFLRRHGYKVISKDIRKYGDGKVKANLDIELVVDMMKTARNLDIAIVISGDGDFAPAIRAVQEQGVRVEVVSFRGNTSSDLMDVADLFTDIAQIAKVEKGSSRSGRRVADDDEDLSMTEVPDKMSEGTGRGRSRGRTRTRPVDSEPVAAAPRSRSRSRTVADDGVAAVANGGGSGAALVALPGEKLSKAAAPAPAAMEPVDDAEDLVDGEPVGEGDDEPRRRRRRRGGRGRGRGRTAQDGDVAGVDAEDADASDADAESDDEDVEDAPAPRPAPAKRPAAHAFGSVWDSQIGMPAPTSGGGSMADDDDLDEPPIPEYLIAERRQRDGRGGATGGRGGVRGARSGYAAAIDRERYGSGGRSGPQSRSGGTPRFSEPGPRSGNREPNRFRDERPAPRQVARVGNSDEPWSEVPPELEAMLRAQIGSRPAPKPAPVSPEVRDVASSAPEAGAAPTETTPTRRRTTRTPAAKAGAVTTADSTAPAAEEAPKKRATRKPAATSAAPADASEAAAPKRRATRSTAKAAEAAPAAEAEPKPAAKRRAPRKTAEPAG